MGTNVREQWAGAVTSTHLEQDSEHESAIDRIGAAAFGPALGRLLWRIRYAGELWHAHPALMVLAGTLRRRWNIHPKSTGHVMVTRVAKQAMREWFHVACRTCDGRGTLDAEALRVVCSTCEGSGEHLYTEPERREACMGPGAEGESWAVWERRLHEAVQMVRSADTATAMAMRQQLERGGQGGGS